MYDYLEPRTKITGYGEGTKVTFEWPDGDTLILCGEDE